MSSRKRNRFASNDDNDNERPSKRRRTSPKSQRSQKSQAQSQIPGIRNVEHNVFWNLLQQCKIRMYRNTSKPIELDSSQSIEYYLQRKLMRDKTKREEFIQRFEEFMEYKDGIRLKQCLQPTVPQKNNRTLFVSDTLKNMSQINENDIASTCSKKQPSLIRILLNVDCLQQKVTLFLQDKLDEFINDESETELVLQILEQFKFLDHLVGDPQQFTSKLFDLLEIGAPIDTQRSIINLFDEIIHDEQHEFVAIKLQQLLERNSDLTESIVNCLSQLKLSVDLKKKVELFLLESLETANVSDLDIIIRYLLRTVDAEDIKQVITNMRERIPFDTEYNHKILEAFKQCIMIQKHVANAVLSVISDCSKNQMLCIDIWLLFILYHKGRLVTCSKIKSLIIKKIEQQHINIKYIHESISNDANKQCLIEIFDAVLYLTQTMLESKNKCVSECGAALYELLYFAMNGHKYQHKLISSITSQIGSGTSAEVNNSLNLLLHLTKKHKSIKLYQTPILLLIDYIESFNNTQIRLLYQIFSLLSINIDSDHQLQIANNLLNLVTKQLAHSGFIHQQKAGTIGCIQLIRCISTKVAVIADNTKEEANHLVQKLIQNAHTNSQLYATMCDEFSLMIEHSRTCNGKLLAWTQYNRDAEDDTHDSDDDDDDIKMNSNHKHNNNDFYPIHKSVLDTLYKWAENSISSWCLHDDDGSQSLATQKPQYKRNGLKPQMWLNLSGKRINHNGVSGIDSEATEYTDNDDAAAQSNTYISITPLFVAQDTGEVMWIFSPLFRLFGILSNATHYGILEHIDSFLTAPLLMFEANDLQTAQMIDKSKVTRNIMGDSMFSAANCIRELLNMFCAEYIAFCRNEASDERNANQNNISQAHSRRKRIETRLCHRVDHLVCLEDALERFMKVNLNQHFLPSFIPSQNKEQTWLNSPPWKRKLLFDDKKKEKKEEIEDNEQDIISTDEEDEDDRNKNKKKKKEKKKKKKKKHKKRKKEAVKEEKNKKKTKGKHHRSPLTKIKPYFRALDLSVGVLLQFEILDRNYYKRAEKRLALNHLTAEPKYFNAMISLRGFHKLLHDFCGKSIEICNNQSARKGFANKKVTENIADYTPIVLLERYGFIFGFIGSQIRELITFIQTIHDTMAGDEADDDQILHWSILPPLIQDCFAIFIECMTKLFKYKQFELQSNRKTFDILLNNLYIVAMDKEEDLDPFGPSFTQMAICVIKLMETICDYVEDINIATKTLLLMDIIMKNSRFDKNMRVDYKVKIGSICEKMLKGNIGDGYIGQIKNASNVGQLVSMYLKHFRDDTLSLQMVAEWHLAFNCIEDHIANPWHALLTKRTLIHFIKPILECITNAYSSAKIQADIQLLFHIKCISHLQQSLILIEQLTLPKTSGYLVHCAWIIFTKTIAKLPKMKQFHNAQHVVNHLSHVESVSRRLQRMIASIRESVGSFTSESLNKQWAKVASKCPKLTKCLDDLVLKAKTYVHEFGLAHWIEIRSLKKTFRIKAEKMEKKKKRKIEKREQEDEKSDEESDEESGEEEDDDQDDDDESGSESDEDRESESD